MTASLSLLTSILRANGSNNSNSSQVVCPIKTLPLEVAQEILKNLDINSIIALSKTCRYFKDITNNPTFWRNVLTSHFGEQFSCSVPDEKCKEAYIKKHREILEFVKSLPNSHLLFHKANKVSSIGSYLSFFSQKSEETQSILFKGLLFPSNFNEYIASLSPEDLKKAFYQCALSVFIPLIKAILQSERFSEIPISGTRLDF